VAGFIWQSGDQLTGSVRGLRFNGCWFWNSRQLVVFWGFQCKFLDDAVFSKCNFSRSVENAFLIQGGMGRIEDCVFCDNSTSDKEPYEGSDISFVALDRPLREGKRVAMDLVWTVRNCRFTPSRRKSGPPQALFNSKAPVPMTPDYGTRAVIGIALVRPPDHEVQGEFPFVGAGVPLVNPGLKVDVTVEHCDCRADTVQPPPLVFVRQMVAGGKLPSGNRSQRINGQFGFEWVRNPGGEQANEQTDTGRFQLELASPWKWGCEAVREPFPLAGLTPGGLLR